jgi:hypothetical protein
MVWPGAYCCALLFVFSAGCEDGSRRPPQTESSVMDVADAPSGTGILTRSAHGCLHEPPLARLLHLSWTGFPPCFLRGGLPGFRGPDFLTCIRPIKAMTEFLASSGIHARPEPSADRTLVVRGFMEAAACGSAGEVTLVHSYVAQWEGRGKKKPTRPIELVEIDQLCCCGKLSFSRSR